MDFAIGSPREGLQKPLNNSDQSGQTTQSTANAAQPATDQKDVTTNNSASGNSTAENDTTENSTTENSTSESSANEHDVTDEYMSLETLFSHNYTSVKRENLDIPSDPYSQILNNDSNSNSSEPDLTSLIDHLLQEPEILNDLYRVLDLVSKYQNNNSSPTSAAYPAPTPSSPTPSSPTPSSPTPSSPTPYAPTSSAYPTPTPSRPVPTPRTEPTPSPTRPTPTPQPTPSTRTPLALTPDALYKGRPQLPDGTFSPDSARNVLKAAKQLDAANLDFADGLENFRMNKKFWTPVSGSPGEFRIKQGMKASDAINDIFKNPDLYSADCRTQTSMAMYKGVLDSIGAYKFDSLYSNNADFSIGPFTTMQFAPAVATGNEIPHNTYGDVDWSKVQPGSYVYFDNPNVSPQYADLWQGENAIYLGMDTSGEPLFSAQGIENDGEPVSADTILDHLNARSTGGGAKVTLIWDM